MINYRYVLIIIGSGLRECQHNACAKILNCENSGKRRSFSEIPGRRIRKTEIFTMLLEKADVQGYLTTEDLVEAYPDISSDVDRLEAIMVALRRQGVDVFDEDEAGRGNEDYGNPPSDMDPFAANLETISSDDTIGLYLKEMSSVHFKRCRRT